MLCVCVFCLTHLYDSGTTGVPKGVVLTQAASVAAISGISAVGDKGTFALITKEDVYISYLPLAHVFERAAQGIHLFKGAALGYYQVHYSLANPSRLYTYISNRETLSNCWTISLNWSLPSFVLFLDFSTVFMIKSWPVSRPRVVSLLISSTLLSMQRRPTSTSLLITGFGIVLSLLV